MLTDVSLEEIMSRKNEIMQRSLKIDYDQFKQGLISFDYEKMMTQLGYSLEDVALIQKDNQVGNTPLLELKNLTQLVRRISPKGKGATILMKDEAANPSGSFKDRRAT